MVTAAGPKPPPKPSLRAWWGDYTGKEAAVGILSSLGALVLLASLDAWIGDKIPLRYLYLFPIWLATRLSGRTGGLILVGVTSIVLSWLDHTAAKSTGSWMIAFALRTGILVIFALTFAQVEDSLRHYNRLAKHDSMTGLLNRRAFAEFAHHAAERAKRLRRPMTFVVFDCDRFKDVNDRFGHATGDEVLRTVGRILEADARSTDMIARLGGDEFVVLLQNTSRVGAKVYAERVQTEFAHEARLLGLDWVSLSCGFAEFGIDGSTVTRLLERADEEMYARKSVKKAHSAT